MDNELLAPSESTNGDLYSLLRILHNLL